MRFIAFSASLLAMGPLMAQTPTFIHTIRTAQYEQFWLKPSPLGGFVAYGTVSDSVDLDPSSADAWITPISGYEEAYLAGYDANGGYLWHKQFPSTLALMITHLSFTEDGQFYLSGEVTGSGDADPGAGTATIACGCTNGPPGFETDYRTGWYGKYTATGDYLWHQQFGSSYASRSAVRMEYSPFSHDLFLFGSVISDNAVDFDPGPGSATITPTPMNPGGNYINTNIYARYDSTGTLIWYRNFGGEVDDVTRWDDGTDEYFYLTGYAISHNLTGALQDHDPGPAVLQPYNALSMLEDVYASKFNADGDLEWCHFFFGGNGNSPFNQNEGGTSVAVNADGDVYVGGEFQSDYANTPGGSLLSMEPFGGFAADALLIKLASADGAVLQEKHMGSTGEDTFGAMCALDADGRVYVASTFENTAELNSNGPSVQVTANGPAFTKDSFLACFDNAGAYQFSGTIGGPEYDGLTQVLPGANSLCIVGNFRATADLDLGPGVDQRTSMAFHDPFFACFDLSGLALSVPVREEAGIIVYPNPANDRVTITGVKPNVPIEVFDALGGRVAIARGNSFATATWAEGLYFVKIGTTTQRIIIQH